MMVQIDHADVGARFGVDSHGGGIAIEHCRERYSDVRGTFETWLAISFAEHTYLGDKVERLGGSSGHTTSQNGFFVGADHGSVLQGRGIRDGGATGREVRSLWETAA